ncbi:MAG: beta-L-arabinofuranosidase domain-containing protein [Terriglobia bacterium]
MSRANLLGTALFGIVILTALRQSPRAAQEPLVSHAQETKICWNKPPLSPNAFAPLPLGSIKPRGWLLRQLQIQANGLSGHLDDFWPDLRDSGWIGGPGESWERGPYYLDGLVPLAFSLNDPRLISKAKKWVDWTIDHQQADGRIGAELGRGNYRTARQESDTWWPNMIMLKVLTQYQEATGDPRVIPLMEKYFEYQMKMLDQAPLREWAEHRWADEVLSIVWLYNRTGNAKLLDLARKIHAQAFDWKANFANFKYKEKTTKERMNLRSHGVNNAMAIKTSAVWWQISGDPSDREAIHQLYAQLDRYHGQPTGVHSCDEHLAGLDPTQGTELCTVVESMFSLEEDVAILGDPQLADRLERITFNALPATFKKDMWAHQYDQQVNQVMCSVTKRHWTDNGPEANIFGLEPNFGCCTANMHQGWPKFTSHLWMATREGGLAAVAYAPSEVSAKVADGVNVAIVEDTDYPFRDTIRFTINSSKLARFPLTLRIPAWAEGATISVDGTNQPGVKPGSFHIVNREWKSGDLVEVKFPMRLSSSRWYHDGVVINRGPLIYSLPIGEQWKKIKGEEPHADWEVLPTTRWNYALAKLPAPGQSVEERSIGDLPFSPEGAPLRLKVRGRRVPGWILVDGSAGPLPLSPVGTRGPEEELTLIPYGCTNLRITVFPTAESATRQAR